jgi:DUF1680 family protein
MNSIILKFRVILILMLFSCYNVNSQTKTILIKDALLPVSDNDVKIEGYLGQKMQLCIENRVKAQNIGKIIKFFQDRNEDGGWRCEYWGKWLTSAVLAYSYHPAPELKTMIDNAVKQLILTQSADGYIGTYQDSKRFTDWDVWGRKYTLLGLLAAYDFTGDKKILEVACRFTDNLISGFGPGKRNIAEDATPVLKGVASSSILEPIVLLYQRTGNVNYLNFAKYIVGQWSIPNKYTSRGLMIIEDALAGLPPLKIASTAHAYSIMSCFEGVCELYRATGDKKYLDAAVKFANGIRLTERMICGSCSNQEIWCDGVREQTELLEQPIETCATVTWMKYCYQLLRITGDPVWADEMEISLYNALLGAMTPKGDWFAYNTPLMGERVPSHVQQKDVELSCCVMNGPRGLLLTPRWAVMRSDKGLAVNLYAGGIYEEKLSDGTPVEIIQKTTYPESGQISIVVKTAKTSKFTVSLRIPAWSQKTKILVNKESIQCKAGKYLDINRSWTSNDTIKLTLDLRGRVVPAPSGAPQLAVMRGPVLLAMDNRLIESKDTAVWLYSEPEGYVKPTPTVSEPNGYFKFRACLNPSSPQEYVELKPVRSKPDSIWMAFEVPVLTRLSHFYEHKLSSLVLCDYASAGNQWSGKNIFRVWMPQPMQLNFVFPENTWKILNPLSKVRTTIPINN